MEINAITTESETTFLARLNELIAGHYTSNDSQRVQEFAKLYFRRFPLPEFQGRQYKDIHGFLASWWDVLQKYEGSQPKVAVYNPNLNEHGWLSSKTVLQVLVKDMPFLTDSVRMELTRRDVRVDFLRSQVLTVVRDSKHRLVQILARHTEPQSLADGQYCQPEALIYFEINAHTNSDELSTIRSAIAKLITNIEVVVDDYRPMVDKATATRDTLNHALVKNGANKALIEESKAFLTWLAEGHFTFLGYSEFDLVKEGQGRTRKLVEVPKRRLGIFSRLDQATEPLAQSKFNRGMADFFRSDDCISFTKSSNRSQVHRSAYSDYVVVKRYDEQGEVCGECRFIGLYTAAVYANKLSDIPLIRHKVDYVLNQTGVELGDYEGKSLVRILETLPRDEMFQVSNDQLLELSTGVAQINERPQIRLFMRDDPYGKFVNCLVFIPKDLFSTRIRTQIQDLISNEIDSEEADFNTYFSESILARCHLVFRLKAGTEPSYDVAKLEQKIIDITRGWDENFYSSLIENHGEEAGTKEYRIYQHAFSDAYREAYDARTAVTDIAKVKQLNADVPVAMSFYQPLGSQPSEIRFKVFQRGESLHLSTVVPILENLGLKVLGEFPYEIEAKGQQTVWLHDFNLQFEGVNTVDVTAAKRVFQDAFQAIWLGQTENDGFNRLVLTARINWREVSILRAYARYMKQTLISFGQGFIANTLAEHVDITRNLIALFKGKFDPRVNQFTPQDIERIERLERKIIESLENVDNLNHDRIIRRYLELILGTLRTNYFQKAEDGSDKDYISFKLAPRDIPDIPEPRPLYEIFVFSPKVEGVHLRGGAVSRGGLRWSDRLQDYRTEVLGLVKAQQVKNAVIVPNGAKGGFVVKQAPKNGTRAEHQAAAIDCYKAFIRGLLDVTDNIVKGKVVAPKQVVRHDQDDPYLVVAADKGTATFSDIANEISLEYGHWLGDAFASGGSQGYDHKGMGITARGAWVSVQRHFKEKGLDIQKEDFSVIAIGDMAGDVFGNGMLLSKHICLTAAFNHMYIFVDPTPDSAKTFAERQRLFNDPSLTWDDYDKSLISKGGGVFSRAAKSIIISAEMKARFDIPEDRLSPTELINRLLKAPVDLVWNGGIGTYVKASSESHSDVGDKANDVLRVNGKDLRCKVFGEGGNLGMTQLGRVEFCLAGGACNTDFIDNAAGVDCSDHEVNIKILIDQLVTQGDLTAKQRNKLLVDMTDSVAGLVLDNNYQQTQAISLAEFTGVERFAEYRRLIAQMEGMGQLNRALEFLPDDETLLDRHSHNLGLTRPEFSVLISYVKVLLKELLANDDIGNDDYIKSILVTAFPELLRKKFPNEITNHILRKEIIATQLANDMINNGGITFYHRLAESTGASATTIARAYITARDVFHLPEFRAEIESLDHHKPAAEQLSEMNALVRRMRRGTRWFLRNRRTNLDPSVDVPFFATAIVELSQHMHEVLQDAELARWQETYDRCTELGLSERFARVAALPGNLYSGLGVIEAARVSQADMKTVAHVFFYLSDRLTLNWFSKQISEVSVETFWQAMARESFLDDMESCIRSLTISFINLRPADKTLDETFARWTEACQELFDRWNLMMLELQSSNATDFAMFSVAMRELSDLAQASSDCAPLFEVNIDQGEVEQEQGIA